MKRQKDFLNDELKKFQNVFCMGYELEVSHLPCPPNEFRTSKEGKPLSGEVIGNMIFVYESDKQKALKTLCHEFFEKLISTHCEKYIRIINSQNQIISSLLYDDKENLIEILMKPLQK